MKTNNVLEYLERSALSFPDKTAFADEHTQVTYREAVQNAKRFATRLLSVAKPRTPVAVLGAKSVEMLIAFFGCAYAGCYYVPLNPAHPLERRERILRTLQYPPVAVASDARALAPQDGSCITVDISFAGEADEGALEKIRAEHIDVDPLYVLFTSGSTGDPKGIAVSHRSVIDFIEPFTSLFHITQDDVIGNQAPFDFDVSVKDIYSTVKAGATMHIIPKQKFSFPTVLIDYLCERKITTLIWAVSALCILSGFRAFTYKTPPDIRKILFSGEAMPVKQLHVWQKYFPDALFVNLYGPTEITCNCTYYVLPAGPFGGDALPIGKPFPNERVFLWGEDGNVVPPDRYDTPGEICVVGTALSLGYYNNPEETNRAFVPSPLAHTYFQTAYRTGDLGYYGADGNLYFTGRRDFQIKHQGHRIELSEIDAALCSCEGVARAICLYDEKHARIYAFYVGKADDAYLAGALRDKLPAYMVPHRFIPLDAFPLTENGKVDRRKLREEHIS